jgi:acetyl esterase/lipase
MALQPRGVKVEKEKIDNIDVEWNTPKKLETEGVILYFHGGGYVAGSLNTHRGLTGRIAKAAKTKCISVEYRLAPENPYPAANDDAIKVYQYLLNKGYASNKIVIAGDSAGGGLALSTLARLNDENALLPAAAVLLSPWLDSEMLVVPTDKLLEEDVFISRETLAKYGKDYAGSESIKHPYVSPVYANPKGLPPIYIQASNHEILKHDTLRFEENAKAAGVEIEVELWDKMVHVWHAFAPNIPEAGRAINKIGDYIFEKVK